MNWILLGTREMAERRRAQDALESMGHRAVPALITLLDHADAELKLTALRLIGRVGPAAKQAVPRLVKSLKDEDRYVRSGAAEALGKVSVGSPETVAAMAEALRDPGKYVASTAAKSLKRFGPRAASAAPALIEALSKAEPDDQGRFDPTIERIGHVQPDTVVPLLIEAWKELSPRARYQIAGVLGELGPLAVSALPTLRQAANDSNVLVRHSVARAIKAIDYSDPAADPPVETERYLRPAGDKFVPESTIQFRTIRLKCYAFRICFGFRTSN